jgi:hypothetical protein
MLRRSFIAASFFALAFVASAPTQALAHGGHVHPEATTTVSEAAPAFEAQRESRVASQSLQSYSLSGDQSANECHCAACHGCCHAPALSDAAAQLAPLSLLSHATPREGGWLTRRWRSSIENPPKTFA